MTQTNDDFGSALADLEKAAKLDRLTEEASKKISQGKVDLVLGRDAKAVFFASVAMRLQMEADASVDTAATDGKRIVYSPEFVAGLSRQEIVGLLAHEVMHVTNAHHARMGDRDPEQWNVACDLAINPLLKQAGVTLPGCGIFPGQGQFQNLPEGLSAEEYYSKLPAPPPQGKQGGQGDAAGPSTGGKDPGRCGGVQKPGKGSPAECRKAEAEAKEMAAAAEQAVQSSGRGELPGGIGRSVRELLQPKADWRTILREFVARAARNDYSWSRPNRRFVHAGIYLPGLHSEEIGPMVLAVDTSGSIGQATLDKFGAEVQGILEAYDCELTVIYCDASVQQVDEWRSTDGPLTLKSLGGGGTSHIPVFEHVNREGIDPACIICLTDMYSVFPPDPGTPTLWCVTGNPNAKAPFGRLVNIDD